MTIKIKLWVIVIVILAIIGGVYFLGGIKYRRQIDNLSDTLAELQEQLKDTIETYEIVVGDNTLAIAEQKRLILNYRDAIRNHVLNEEKLKRLHIASVSENVRLKAQISVLKDSLEMVKPEIIYVVDSSDVPVPHLKLPHSFSYEDDYAFLGVDIDESWWNFNFVTDVSIDLTLADKKVGLFKREPTAFAQIDNPYMGQVKIQSLSIKKEPLFYETLWFKLLTHGAAFAGGFYLGGR